MNYEKQTWAPGELITSAKLNHMEKGIEDAGNAVALPEITASDDGKAMVAKNGEWVNVELLKLSKEYVVLQETDVNLDQDERPTLTLDVAAIKADGLNPYNLQYTLTHNGTEYELAYEPNTNDKSNSGVMLCGNGIMLYLRMSGKDVIDPGNSGVIDNPPSGDILKSVKPISKAPALTVSKGSEADAPDFNIEIEYLPDTDDGHRISLKAKSASAIVSDIIPFAIKAGAGSYAISEGDNTTADGYASHAEGYGAAANGIASHAEGDGATASGSNAHAEGYRTTASGAYSHAEGAETTASGPISHAEGQDTTASGPMSHAEGISTIANHASQHVFGEFNVADPSEENESNRGTYVEIVGNGTIKNATMSRSNARTLDWDGNEVLAGKLTVGAAPTADMDVATKKYVDDNAGGLPEITAADDGKVMVAVGGEWVNEELLTVGTEHVILPETEGVSTNSQYNLDLTAFPSVSLTDLQYIAIHNGRRYELGTIYTPEGYFAVYPPDFDIMQLSEDNMPEVAIAIMQGDSASVCMVAILPEDTSHTLTLMAKPKTVVKDEHIPFAIKAGSGMRSIAEGEGTTASNVWSHAEGSGTTASGMASHAEGYQTTASGMVSHVEGRITTASGDVSHAEGNRTTASGSNSHAEGDQTTASGSFSHAEGEGSTYKIGDVTYESGAKGEADHTEGYQTMTAAVTGDGNQGNHAEGYRTKATGGAAHSEGKETTASGPVSHAEGRDTTASGSVSHAEGGNTVASAEWSHAEGSNTTASGDSSHAEGATTTAGGSGSHAEGSHTTASGGCSHAEGYSTTASGNRSHAEGQNTTASGSDSHAEGVGATASGDNSHAEGRGGTYTINNVTYESGAKGTTDHTEGYQTLTAAVTGDGNQGNHAEGYRTKATGGAAHSEGKETTASGAQSHAEGERTTASGIQSHTEGHYTTANHKSQHVFGEYNVADPSTAAATARGTYIEIVGNGTSDGARSNARALDWDGNEVLAGGLTVGAAGITIGSTTIHEAELRLLLGMIAND